MAKMKISKEKWQEVYGLFDCNDHEELLLRFVWEHNTLDLFEAVKHGAVLSAKVLWYMLETGQNDLIPDLIPAAQHRSENVYYFLKTVSGEAFANQFVLENNLKDLFDKLDEVFLAEKQQWEILAERDADDLLAENGQFDLLEQKGAWLTLINYKQYERIIKAEVWDALKFTHRGMEKLAELGRWDDFYNGYECRATNGFTKQEILEKLWDNGQKGLLFKAQEDKFLMQKGWFEPYQKEGLWATIAGCGYPEQVDWEAYLDKTPEYNRKAVFKEAKNYKIWSFLANHHQSRILFWSGQFGWWLKSF